MVKPLFRAHERTSALSGEFDSVDADEVALRARVFFPAARVLAPLIAGEVPSIAAFVPAGLLVVCADVILASDGVSPASAAETVSVTP
jgi:hypothetical protein